jgi:hypothetical protein
MKKQILIYIAVWFLFAGQLAAQSAITENQDINDLKSYYHQGDELWLNDTTVHYLAENNIWTPEKRIIVVSRDGIGQELETISEQYIPQTKEWQKFRKNNKAYYYLYDKSIVKEQISFVWDPVHYDWILTASVKFDANGNLTERISKEIYGNQIADGNGTKESFSYNARNGLSAMTLQHWNVEKNTWELQSRKKINYNLDTRIEITNTDMWSIQSNSWLKSSKTIIEKNEFGDVISKQHTNYSVNGSVVNGVENINYQYDQYGQLVELEKIREINGIVIGDKEMNYIRENGEIAKKVYLFLNADGKWIVDKENSFKYIPYQNRIVNIERAWDNVSQEWFYVSRNITLKDGELVMNTLQQIWEISSETWINLKQLSFDYSNGTMTSKSEQLWNTATKEWSDVFETKFEYNSAKQVISETGSSFGTSLIEWTTEYNKSWTYDQAGNISEFIIKRNNQNMFLDESKKISYNWHMFALSITESKENYTIEVFPNPTKGVLHIQSNAGTLSRIAILDEFGRLIEAISLDQQSTTVDISHLASGNYFIECKNGSRKNTFKVVKL